MIEYNKDIYIKINNEEGYIASIIYKNKEFIKEKMPIFDIRFRNKKGEITQKSTYDTKFEKIISLSENEYIITYVSQDNMFDAEVYINISEEISWKIYIKNNTELVIEYVDFPQIVVAKDLKANGGNSQILWGFNEGVIVDDIEHREKACKYLEPQYPGEGIMGIFPAIVETQFMAYYDDICGIYLGTHDNEGNMKGIDFYPYKEGIKLQFRLFTNCNFGDDYDMSFPFVMKMFLGDWHDAASIYRNWFEKNKSEKFVPIEENIHIPTWYGDSPIVVTYPVRGLDDTDEMFENNMYPYINGMKHVEDLAKKLDSKIMVLLMHWEGTAPWAPPYVWPPYGGEEELKKFVDALHEEGHLIGVYCSGLGWTQQSCLIKEYNCEKQFLDENLQDAMCLSPEGKLRDSKICVGQRSGFDLCPSVEFTKNVIVEQATKIMSIDIDYIQTLDQNHGGTSYFCHNHKHNHPPVAGKWQQEEVNSILKRIIDKADKKVLLGCESAAAETYIPNLLFNDNRFNLAYWIGKAVPVYAYVYHEYINNFMGNQVYVNNIFDYTKNPENIFMRIAYAFCAGDMTTLVLNENGKITWNWGRQQVDFLPNQEEVIEYVKELNAMRTKTAKKYLHLGKMIKPIEVISEENQICERDGFTLSLKKIFTSRWRANDGTKAQFLVNYNNDCVNCIVKTSNKYNIFGDTKNIVHTCERIEIEMKPHSVIMMHENF